MLLMALSKGAGECRQRNCARTGDGRRALSRFSSLFCVAAIGGKSPRACTRIHRASASSFSCRTAEGLASRAENTDGPRRFLVVGRQGRGLRRMDSATGTVTRPVKSGKSPRDKQYRPISLKRQVDGRSKRVGQLATLISVIRCQRSRGRCPGQSAAPHP